jgi:hypothetical protein
MRFTSLQLYHEFECEKSFFAVKSCWTPPLTAGAP